MDTSPDEPVLFFADKMERTKVNYSIRLLAIYEKMIYSSILPGDGKSPFIGNNL